MKNTSTKYIITTFVILAALGFGGMMVSVLLSPATAAVTDNGPIPTNAQADMFVKFDGVDGEAKDSNHHKWIELLSISTGARTADGAATGQSRRRGATIVEDMTLTMEYDKASPKLEEAVLIGKVFPKVEIHLTSTYGGARATYLKYELKNVMITSYQTNASSGHVPVEDIALNFEEVKVTYTEYDDTGSPKGNVEYEWKVEKGTK